MLNIAAQEKARTPVGDDEPEIKVLYVCPAPIEKPDDGILHYVSATSVYDFQQFPAFSVCLIDSKTVDVLTCVNAHRPVFGVSLLYLIGVPKAEYTPTFEAIVWDLERVSYDSLVSELALAREARETLEAQNASVHDKERATYVRKTGQVKGHQALVLRDSTEARVVEDSVDDDVDEEVE